MSLRQVHAHNAFETMQPSLAYEPLLAGRYAHVRELGRGASGRVLLCADRIAGASRAVKIVSAEDAERLRWELTLLSSIAHPGLARVHELVTLREPLGPPFRLEPGAAVLVEEHVDGASAAEVVASLATEEERVRFAVTVGIAVARALGAIHAAGLVHGDVKPANVVVPEDPSLAKLVDLGLARAPGLSATLSGTPGYLAPEAWLGERSVATDLYALGATLHALCAGRSAFDTEGSTQSLARALAARPTAAELPTAAPIALRRLVGDLLADAPSERPASAREVALRLSALASEVGALVPDADAVAEAPSPVERAARSRAAAGRPARGAPALVAALRSPGVHVVSGPPGAGRSRLVREAVRALQAEAARAGGRVPTYVAASDARVPRLAHDAVVHLEGCRLERAAWEAAVEAAAACGVALSIVAEPSEDAPDAVLHLGPLDDPSLRRLLAELLELDPAPPLLAAARAASGGLAGRLCRLVAEGFEAGLDPSRPGTLEELGRRSATRAWIPHRARPLAELLAAAGGALDAEAAAALLPDAAEQALALRAAGVAHEARGKIALRADLCAVMARGFASEARRALADRLAAVSLDAHAAAHVHAARGELDGARESFLEAMREAREAGDPERAAAIGAEGLAACAGDVSVALAAADALRACAREAEALAILEGRPEPDAVALRAELARLRGDHARARAEAERAAESALARATLARLSLADGDPERALALADAPAEGAAAARLAEARAFAQLALGRFEDASAEAARGLAGARRSGSLAEEARAIGTEGVVLASVGRVDEAARRY
ncbi:MAG: serine/threonine protein kinase [Sandaracinaceae bacterium]|nr:serine/threonine protein kinase [Sandaracinaceae bacterium]